MKTTAVKTKTIKILGIDYGEARIGLALFDDPEFGARALDTVDVTVTTAVKIIAARAIKEGASSLVVGLPLRMDGKEGGPARNVRKFAQSLAAVTKLTVAFQDERLTSAQAHTERKQSGAVTDRRGIDARAATILLETYLAAKGLLCPKPSHQDDYLDNE